MVRTDTRERAEDDQERANRDIARSMTAAKLSLKTVQDELAASTEVTTAEKVKVDAAEAVLAKQREHTLKQRRRKLRLEARGERAAKAAVARAAAMKAELKLKTKEKAQKEKEANVSSAAVMSMDDLAKQQMADQKAALEADAKEKEEEAQAAQAAREVHEAEKLEIRRERMRKQLAKDLVVKQKEELAAVKQRVVEVRQANAELDLLLNGTSERNQYKERLAEMLEEKRRRQAEIDAGHILIYPESVRKVWCTAKERGRWKEQLLVSKETWAWLKHIHLEEFESHFAQLGVFHLRDVQAVNLEDLAFLPNKKQQRVFLNAVLCLTGEDDASQACGILKTHQSQKPQVRAFSLPDLNEPEDAANSGLDSCAVSLPPLGRPASVAELGQYKRLKKRGIVQGSLNQMLHDDGSEVVSSHQLLVAHADGPRVGNTKTLTLTKIAERSLLNVRAGAGTFPALRVQVPRGATQAPQRGFRPDSSTIHGLATTHTMRNMNLTRK